MENLFRTDLACEAKDLWRQAQSSEPEGVFARREERDGFGAEVVEIRTQEAADKLCKPVGRYVTLELDALLRREEDAFPRACGVLSSELRSQLDLQPGESVLVVGLGNPDITPDALGPLSAEHILPTRHLPARLGEGFAGLRSVAVFLSGVLGTTGVESAELTAAVVERTRPDRVIAVDALSAREARRLCRTVQISDTGIVPGSGVGNARAGLTRESLGVPVISVGVPTVVDAFTLCKDFGAAEPSVRAGELFVTPRDIDARVRSAARLVGYAIDLALHDGMTVSDIDLFLS